MSRHGRVVRASLTMCIALSCGTAIAQSAYKCVDEKGRTTLQQAPCANGKPVHVTPSSFGPPPVPPSRAEVAVANAMAERQEAIAAGLHVGYPVVGMNQAQLAQVLGNPDRLNTSDYGRGLEEQRIYERGVRTLYVYTAGAFVRGIQNDTRIASRAKQSCPTDTELRNARVSASSITMTGPRLEALLKQIKEMEAACK